MFEDLSRANCIISYFLSIFNIIYIHQIFDVMEQKLFFFEKYHRSREGKRQLACLVLKIFCKFFYISRHIESCDTCMEH